MDIDSVLENITSYSLEEFFDIWRGRDEIFMIKYDGERESNNYTVVLICPEMKFEPIRLDCAEVLSGIRYVMLKFKEVNNCKI